MKLNNFADAMEFIEKQDKGWYDQLAVSFRDYSKTQDSKEICKLREKCNQKEKELYELIIKPHFIACKSKFVSCKNCESKISTKYLINVNYCAVCREDLRPQTVIQKISNKEKEITLLNEKINHKRKELERKGKYDFKWLVKIEYHV